MDPHTTSAAPKPKPKPTNPTTKAPPTKAPPAHTVPDGGSNSSSVPEATGSISPSSTPTSDKSSSFGGLSTPAIAGIAAAGGLIVLFIISVILCKRRRAQRYSRRDHDKHDPSRDPINPNDVLPPLPLERKFESIPLEEGFNAYPLASRIGGDNGSGDRSKEGPLRTNPSQQALQQDYPHYEEHIQSHFETNDRNVRPARIETQGGGSNGGVGSVTSPTLSHTSMERSRIHGGVVAPMSPSQRAQQHSGNTPRSPRSPRSQPNTVVNDMGNQFVIQPSNSNPGSHRPSQDGSAVGSDQGHRSRQPPRNQDPNGGRRGPGNHEGPGYGYGPGPYAGSPPVGPHRGGPSSSGSPVSQHSQQQPYQQQPYQHPQQQSRPFPPQNQQPQQPYMYPPQPQQQQQGYSGNPRQPRTPY